MLLVRGDVCVYSYFAVCLCVIFTNFNRLLQNQLGQIQTNCPKYFIVKVSKLYPYTNNNRAYTLISCKKIAKEQFCMHVLILVSISTVVNLFCVSICKYYIDMGSTHLHKSTVSEPWRSTKQMRPPCFFSLDNAYFFAAILYFDVTKFNPAEMF